MIVPIFLAESDCFRTDENHSGGGQAVQCYAVVGTAAAQVAAQAIHVRFVIANPSSYLYFTDYRSSPHGFGCSDWNHWKYGIRDAAEYVTLSPATHGRKWRLITPRPM